MTNTQKQNYKKWRRRNVGNVYYFLKFPFGFNPFNDDLFFDQKYDPLEALIYFKKDRVQVYYFPGKGIRNSIKEIKTYAASVNKHTYHLIAKKIIDLKLEPIKSLEVFLTHHSKEVRKFVKEKLEKKVLRKMREALNIKE